MNEFSACPQLGSRAIQPLNQENFQFDGGR
jgi:hypothetical protein